jgi:hypothetical protein
MPNKNIAIVGSYSENVSPENHGLPGMKFENRSFFLSVSNESLKDGTTEEEIKEMGARLHALAKAVVKESARLEIRELQKDAGILVEPTADEYKDIADIIVAFEISVTKADVDKANEMATERKDKLNDVQLEFLRHIARKANARAIN